MLQRGFIGGEKDDTLDKKEKKDVLKMRSNDEMQNRRRANERHLRSKEVPAGVAEYTRYHDTFFSDGSTRSRRYYSLFMGETFLS